VPINRRSKGRSKLDGKPLTINQLSSILFTPQTTKMANSATEITKKSLEEMDLKELFLMSKDIEDLISALFQRQSIIQEVIGQHLEDVNNS